MKIDKSPPVPDDDVLNDASKQLYYVIWSVAETTGDLATSFGTWLDHYSPGAKKTVLFNKHSQDSLAQSITSGQEEEELKKSGWL